MAISTYKIFLMQKNTSASKPMAMPLLISMWTTSCVLLRHGI